jgi:hypothetical protein
MPATTATIPHAEYERASLAPTSNTFNIPVVANLSENWGDEQGRLRLDFRLVFSRLTNKDSRAK